MLKARRAEVCLLLLGGLCVPAEVWGQASAAIRGVKVLGSKDAVEIEIEASDRLVPQTRVLTSPDRLVVDFPNAVPGPQVRSQSVERGEVKDIRVGLFQSKPPITRIVLDLKAAQSYQVFPYSRTVIIKVTGAPRDDASAGVDDFPPESPIQPGLVNTKFPTRPLSLGTGPATKPALEVSFHDGLLMIRANKASLSEVLFAVHQRTGAEVAIAAGAEQEKVAADIGPGPAAEVISSLLNGSSFNFLIVNSANDPRQLERVILTARGEGSNMPGAVAQTAGEDDDIPEPVAPVVQSAAPAGAQAAPGQQVPPSTLDAKQPDDDNTPD